MQERRINNVTEKILVKKINERAAEVRKKMNQRRTKNETQKKDCEKSKKINLKNSSGTKIERRQIKKMKTSRRQKIGEKERKGMKEKRKKENENRNTKNIGRKKKGRKLMKEQRKK